MSRFRSMGLGLLLGACGCCGGSDARVDEQVRELATVKVQLARLEAEVKTLRETPPPSPVVAPPSTPPSVARPRPAAPRPSRDILDPIF